MYFANSSKVTYLAALEPGHVETSDGVQWGEFPPGITQKSRSDGSKTLEKPRFFAVSSASFREAFVPFLGIFATVLDLD